MYDSRRAAQMMRVTRVLSGRPLKRQLEPSVRARAHLEYKLQKRGADAHKLLSKSSFRAGPLDVMSRARALSFRAINGRFGKREKESRRSGDEI